MPPEKSVILHRRSRNMIAQQMNLLPIEVIQYLLQDRRVKVVAQRTGIPDRAVTHIRNKGMTQIDVERWKLLSDYFTRQFRQAGYVQKNAGRQKTPE